MLLSFVAIFLCSSPQSQFAWELLIQQIEASVMDGEATLRSLDQHGQRYQIDLTITEIEQRQQETVRTGWIVRPDEDFARLVTLYILNILRRK